MRQREIGVCRAFCKGEGGYYVLDKNEYDRLKADWMAGKAFFEGVGFYGQPVVFRLMAIEGITVESAEIIVDQLADKAADRKEDDLQ